MKIEQIRYVLEIYKTGSISKAAQKFYMSRPNMSNSVRNLENEVGFEILERSVDGVKFTKKGQAFIRHCMNIIKEVDEIQELAEEKGLDLVKISPNAKPPVCKLMDYDKHRYEQAKRERELRKNQRVVELKEVQLSATIEENDVLTKAKMARRFLEDGDKVKVSIRFRGRQIAHADIGMKIMQDFASRIEEYGTIERRPMLEGRHMIMILGPKAEKKSFAEKSQARKEKHAANQAAAAEAPREPKPQPKKKVKRESENMI